MHFINNAKIVIFSLKYLGVLDRDAFCRLSQEIEDLVDTCMLLAEYSMAGPTFQK
jgi:hypothetical protein